MTKNRLAPRLDDVAKAAGVSTATVSRCLNTPERVVEKTRKRVMAAVEALGYTPNFAARLMAAKHSYTIGAIIPTMENAIFARGLQAFQDELRNKGYTLLVSSSAYEPRIEKEQIQTLVARGADGLLLIGHERDAQIYEYLKQQGVPALVAWSFQPGGRLPSVGFDNHDAIYALAEEVIKAGHRRVAMISGISRGNDRARLRIAGVRSALARHGISPQTLRIIETAYGTETGAAAFARLMAETPRPTAVMCGNDVLAAGALHMAGQLGIRVPDEVSITGFDDIELARIVTPGLTTVHVPHREMGQKAATALLTLVEGAGSGQSTCMETRIVTRDSLASAPLSGP